MEQSREIRIATAIARMETKIDVLVEVMPKITTRVESLERWKSKLVGGAAVIVFLLGVMGFKVFF